MTTGNGVSTATDSGEVIGAPDGSRQLRDIEELVAKLRIVTKQLELPPCSCPGRGPDRSTARPVGRARRGRETVRRAEVTKAVRQSMKGVSWG